MAGNCGQGAYQDGIAGGQQVATGGYFAVNGDGKGLGARERQGCCLERSTARVYVKMCSWEACEERLLPEQQASTCESPEVLARRDQTERVG